jgi:hypothetical protein
MVYRLLDGTRDCAATIRVRYRNRRNDPPLQRDKTKSSHSECTEERHEMVSLRHTTLGYEKLLNECIHSILRCYLFFATL